MRVFSIFGDIVEDGYKTTESDICLLDFKRFLDTVDDGEDVMIDICSCGGSVFQGLAIANMIGQFRNLHKCYFTAHVVSVAASIASVIASACDEIKMDSNSLFMVHLPYSCNVTGNAIELEKEIQQLNQCKNALIAFYKTKFSKTEEEIEKMLEEETWIQAENASEYGLKCSLIETTEPMRIAASIKNSMKKFNIPNTIRKIIDMEKEEKKTNPELSTSNEETIEEVKKEVIEEVIEEKEEGTPMTEEEIEKKVVEETTNIEEEKKPSYEELEKKIEELTMQLDECQKKLNECNLDEDVEKRVSGMQSKMQNKINNITKDFMDKLELKDKELSEMKNQVSDLANKLETTSKEFSEMKSAYDEKKTTLAKLNASVLTPKENSTDWRNLKGEQFIKWAEAHKDEIKQNKII